MSNIIFDGKRHCSIASIPEMRSKTIISSGFSKTFSWTGGRIGYAIYPTADEADIAKNLNINYFSCVPAYNQEGARVAYQDKRVAEQVAHMVEVFQKRRDTILPQINSIPGFYCQKPGGAFYLFPNIAKALEQLGALQAFDSLTASVKKTTSPSTLFQMFALFKHGVAVMDRKSFGRIGAEQRHFIRLSIAADESTLERGVERLRLASADVSGFNKFVAVGENLS